MGLLYLVAWAVPCLSLALLLDWMSRRRAAERDD